MMETEQFILKLLDIIIWPMTVLIVVLFLRKPLVRLVPFLKKLKYKDLELDFDRKVKKLRKKVGNEIVGKQVANFSEDTLHEISFSPRSAIIEAWIRLEHAVRAALKENGVALSRMDYISTAHLIDSVASANIMETKNILLLKRLRDLRNVAAHSKKFRVLPESAVEYVELAMGLEQGFTKSEA